MPRRQHPADIRNAEIIAGAIRYEIALFLGRGRYAKASAESLDAALTTASELARQHPNGRLPLIYAIDAANRSALVEYGVPDATEGPMKKHPSKNEQQPRAAKTAKGNGGKPPRMTPARIAELEAAAREGKLPPPPDFSAPTHARFRGKLARLVALAEAGDAKGLRAIKINPVSSSPKAMARYRDLCLIALKARRP